MKNNKIYPTVNKNKNISLKQLYQTSAVSKFGLQVLPQCDSMLNCLSRFVPEVHLKRCWNRPVGLVVKASATRADDPGFESSFCAGIFLGSSHTSDLKIGTPVPGAWRYRVSARTGRPGVSIL